MIKKKDFLKEYNIEKETLKKTGMKWEELNSIYAAAVPNAPACVR